MGLLSGPWRGPRLALALVAVASLGAFAIGLGVAIDRGRPASTAIALPEAAPAASLQPQASAPPGASLPGLDVMVERLEAKVKDGGGTAEQWALLGQTYLELGRTADARRAFERARAMDPAAVSPAVAPR